MKIKSLKFQKRYFLNLTLGLTLSIFEDLNKEILATNIAYEEMKIRVKIVKK